MKHIFWMLTLFVAMSCATNVTKKISAKEFQINLQKEWINVKTTPLHEDERSEFPGITFFPIQNKYDVTANAILIENGQNIILPTSAKKEKKFKEYALLSFEIEGKKLELTAYQSDPIHADYPYEIFIPFTDLTNGKTTYSGGRYIDLDYRDFKNGKIKIDFNKAYNPYCAYSKYYNCPIPPQNNDLDFSIESGVSYFEKH